MVRNTAELYIQNINWVMKSIEKFLFPPHMVSRLFEVKFVTALLHSGVSQSKLEACIRH